MARSEHLGHCNICDKRLTSWDLRCSKVLGYKHPICERCIAKEYGMNTTQLRDRLEDFFGMRPCQGREE